MAAVTTKTQIIFLALDTPGALTDPKIFLKSKTAVVCFSHKCHKNTNPRRNYFLMLKVNTFSAKIEVDVKI